MQVDPVDDAVRITVGGPGGFAERNTYDFLAGAHVVHAQAGRKEGHLAHRIGEAQVIEHPEDVGPELDAGADFAEGDRLLQHRHRMACAAEYVGGGEAADAATGDEQVQGSCGGCHGSFSGEMLSIHIISIRAGALAWINLPPCQKPSISSTLRAT